MSVDNVSKQPNILLIMADQLRGDITEELTTCMDLASSGVTFSEAYCNAPICAPSRISFATGLRPHRIGALDNHAWLPLRVPTLYQALRDSGYRVAGIGKLDLAKPDGFNGRDGRRPLTYSWGFTDPFEVEGKLHAGRGDPPNGPYTAWLQSQGLLQVFTEDYRKRASMKSPGRSSWSSRLPPDSFADSYIGRNAREWLKNCDHDFPWFCQVNFVGPHNPYDPPAISSTGLDVGSLDNVIDPNGHSTPEQFRRDSVFDILEYDDVITARSHYLAAAQLIDHEISQLIDVLEQRGERDNTWIFVTADHGEMLGDHGLWTKNVFYDAAIRVPLIAAPPKSMAVQHGSVNTRQSELIDLHETVRAIAGLPVGIASGCSPRDGRVLPGLGFESTPRESAVTVTASGAAIITPEYKLVSLTGGTDRYLFDRRTDPSELNSLHDDNSAVSGSLGAELIRQLHEGEAYR